MTVVLCCGAGPGLTTRLAAVPLTASGLGATATLISGVFVSSVFPGGLNFPFYPLFPFYPSTLLSSFSLKMRALASIFLFLQNVGVVPPQYCSVSR
jgi:hypothetical protein